MNTRPLTYLSDENYNECITPSKVIYGDNINRRKIVDHNNDVITLDKTLIKTQIKHIIAVTNYFWNRFIKNICHHYGKNVFIIKTMQTKNENLTLII